jgi:hypothetical protein
LNFGGFCWETQDMSRASAEPFSMKSGISLMPQKPVLPWLDSGKTMWRLLGSCFATRSPKSWQRPASVLGPWDFAPLARAESIFRLSLRG